MFHSFLYIKKFHYTVGLLLLFCAIFSSIIYFDSKPEDIYLLDYVQIQ